MPVLRASWCSCAAYATIATIRLFCIVDQRANVFFRVAAPLSGSRRHTLRELEGPCDSGRRRCRCYGLVGALVLRKRLL